MEVNVIRRRAPAVSTEEIVSAARELGSKRADSPPGRRGVGEVVLNLANADSNGLLWNTQQRLYGLVVSKGGSDQGVVLTLKSSAGTITLRPGDRVDDVMDDIEVSRSSAGLSVGAVTLKIFQSPDAEYTETANGSAVDGGKVTYTAAQSSLVNIPSDTAPRTQGVSLRGGKGVRAIVSAPNGQTVTLCTIKWWVRDELVGRWAEGSTEESLSTGRRDVAGSDQFVQVSNGEAFAEVRSSTSSGAGDFTVVLTAN